MPRARWTERDGRLEIAVVYRRLRHSSSGWTPQLFLPSPGRAGQNAEEERLAVFVEVLFLFAVLGNRAVGPRAEVVEFAADLLRPHAGCMGKAGEVGVGLVGLARGGGGCRMGFGYGDVLLKQGCRSVHG